jgi:hypothetical protein
LAALARLVSTLAEDAIFALSTGGGLHALEGTARRRADAYSAVLAGHRLNTMSNELDHWLVEMTRVAAPVFPPTWLPMGDVLREKVTLEVGARGLRSLFSSKPTDKDVFRVKRLGTLTVRVLRAVLAADGPLDDEEQRTIACVIAALGLPEEYARPLYTEEPIPIPELDAFGELEPAFCKALLRGAWLAAAADVVDPREEHVVRVVGNKLNVPPMDLEVMRNDVTSKLEARRMAGHATVDAIRFVLSDRIPGNGVTLAAKTGWMILPRRYRDEVMAEIGHGTKVALARRYAQLASEDKGMILGIAWAAAHYEDPSISRRALLRARHERLAQDLGEDGAKSRFAVDEWFNDVLAPAALPMAGD